MMVMYSEILQAIEQGSDTYQKLQNCLGVGTGCNSCVDEVYEILKQQGKE